MDCDYILNETTTPSNEKDEWRTPRDLFNGLNVEFKFTLDPCSTAENALCDQYYTVKENGLKQSWKGHRVFMNPPYSRGELEKWIRKACIESIHATIVALVPANKTEQPWWHDYVLKTNAEIRWLRGRVAFRTANGASKTTAPFPSVILIWR